jgi:hypothetical protein
MLSATGADQNGLTAIGLAIQNMGEGFSGTLFRFENGTAVQITSENYQSIMSVWVPFRQSFF